MLHALLVAAGCALPLQIASSEVAYLVIDATVSLGARQPTWLALLPEDGEEIHVPTGGAPIELPPGRYRIEHVHFHKSLNVGPSIQLSNEDEYSFDLEPGTIGYFGVLRIQKRFGRLQFALLADTALLERACKSKPEIFANRRLHLINREPRGEGRYVACGAT